MKYMLNISNYHTFSIYEVNKLKPRSYFIPYPDRASADAVSLLEKRYRSAKVDCLNGRWDFCFFDRPVNLPVPMDTDQMKFDSIDVPSCWQFRGYDHPFYVNYRYQFPYNPPVIPTTGSVGTVFSWTGADTGVRPRWVKPKEEYNHVGVYRRFFTLDSRERQYILSFLGVASCLDLYINGSFVGYSEGSHNIAEFDITPYVHGGENEVVAVVHRWCTGTYLEAQDMFRNNGIFRDVLLFKNDPIDFLDIDFKTVKTEKEGTQYDAEVMALLTGDAEVTFTLKGYGIDQQIKVQSHGRMAAASFRDLPVIEWNAENPVLYDLYCEMDGSCVKTSVGFKKVSIEGRLFKVNDHLVKFHGVNHHDTSPVNGYTLTPEEILRDVQLCKEYNIDTIRTSHYPPDPLLLELCDAYGLYTVDEADLETHGTFAHKLPPSYNRISDDPKWADRYVDRVSRLYERDKMHVSVVMWSLGNEAGGTYNTDREYEYIHLRSDIPVHYESVVHTGKKAYDVASQMYPSAQQVHAAGEGTGKVRQFNDRPYFLCEYAHAMGVGPGNTESYWKEIYSHDSLMGGCVWEMVDHAVLHEDGSYTYGGDHGEWEHDGNFCVDGLFYPDRKPSTGAKIIRYIYRPLRVEYLGDYVFEIFNTTAFTDSSRYRLICQCSDGRSVTIIPHVAPLEKKKVHITFPPAQEDNHFTGDLLLTISTKDTRTGKILAEEQLTLEKRSLPAENSFYEQNPASEASLPDWFHVSEEEGVTLQLDASSACQGSPYTILFRAATDNDTDLTMRNVMKPFYQEQEEILSVTQSDASVTVKTKLSLKSQTWLVTDRYEACGEGILVTSHLHLIKGSGMVPRFGKTFRLDAAFSRVTYQGRSGESYIDMKEQFPVEICHCSVEDMTEPNIHPQESGNRCDTTWVILSNGQESIRFDAVDRPFELSVKPYSDLELIGMKHREDEKVTGTYITINAFQMGIGTGSCGPLTAPEFTYSAKEDYELRFLIRRMN